MRFLKKNILYQLLFVLVCVHTNYAQTPLNPLLLLKAPSQQKEQYQFYSFENETISLYEINMDSNYYKIWEYQLLKNKEAEIISMLFGDITGNGEQELIVLLYVFGEYGEIYVFPTNNNIPTQPPSIYTLSSLRKGTKPMEASLIKWDEDKDSEIILTLSSPERKVLLLDYRITQLEPIQQIAQDFMGTTYGPVSMEVFDYNQDGAEDFLLYALGSSRPHNKRVSLLESNLIRALSKPCFFTLSDAIKTFS